MAKSNYELIVVGAGVVGMGIALAAHKKGVKKILVIDRHQACTAVSYTHLTLPTICSV